MENPTPQNNQNLDELTRLTLRVIGLEGKVEGFENWLKSEIRTFVLETIGKENGETMARLKILEEARKKQIELNATFLQKGAVIQSKAESIKSIWDFFKK